MWQAPLPQMLPKVKTDIQWIKNSFLCFKIEIHSLSYVRGRVLYHADEQQGSSKHPKSLQGYLVSVEAHLQDPQLAGVAEEIHCGVQGDDNVAQLIIHYCLLSCR